MKNVKGLRKIVKVIRRKRFCLKMGKIYTAGFNVDIIDFLADSLLRENAKDMPDLSSIAIVFPGKRPQFYLRKALAHRIKKAFLPPQIFSIEEFIQYLAKSNAQLNHQGDYQPIGLIDACFLIYNLS